MSEILVIAEWTIHHGNEDEVMRLLTSIEQESRQEPGCISFEGFVSRVNPRRVTLVERYADREAFAVHRVSAHFRTIVQNGIAPLLDERTVSVHDLIERL